MRAFEYRSPTTLGEALHLLAAGGAQARLMAGGTDLIVQMRHGRAAPEQVVDVKRIPELCQLSYSPEEGLVLGAAVPCADVAALPAVREYYPALADGAGIIGGVAVRQRATLGGNLCNASPSADGIPPLIVLDARCRVMGPQGERWVPVAEFCTGPGRTVLGPGEVLVSLHLAPPNANVGARYLRFTPRGEMDIAVVGAAAWVTLDAERQQIEGARLALGAVGPTPVMAQLAAAALVGQIADEPAYERAAALAREAVSPISDVRGSLEQRRHLVGVLVKRALRGAVQRARGETLHD